MAARPRFVFKERVRAILQHEFDDFLTAVTGRDMQRRFTLIFLRVDIQTASKTIFTTSRSLLAAA
jgi:hypothetical protein